MRRFILIICLSLALPVLAQPVLVQEENFFGIPGLENLSTGWFLIQSDSTESGFNYPVDVEILKLSPSDYRLVILDAYSPHVFAFHIDRQYGLRLGSIDRSGLAPDTCAYAIAMCLVQQGTYFNPLTDRLAVALRQLVQILSSTLRAVSRAAEFRIRI